MPGQGRLGDKAQVQQDAHGCPGCPHPGVGPAISGSPNVLVNGRPALRVDDSGIHAVCCGPNMWQALQGSATVFINGKPAFRKNDPSKHCGGQGKLTEGSDDVIVGDSGGAGSGSAGKTSASGGDASSANGGGSRANQAAGSGGNAGSSNAGNAATAAAASTTAAAAAIATALRLRVVDPAQRACTNVKVTLSSGHDDATQTDGAVAFAGLTPGSVTAQLRHDLYEPLDVPLTLADGHNEPPTVQLLPRLFLTVPAENDGNLQLRDAQGAMVATLPASAGTKVGTTLLRFAIDLTTLSGPVEAVWSSGAQVTQLLRLFDAHGERDALARGDHARLAGTLRGPDDGADHG